MNTDAAIKKRKLTTMLAHGIHFIYRTCIEPRSESEDDRRHEFILNIILSGSIVLVAAMDMFIAISSIAQGDAYRGVPLAAFSILLGFFIFLLALSRRGHFTSASYFLIGLYFFSSTYCVIRWGVELPLAGFGYVITITIASILISTRFGFIMTSIIAAVIITVGWLQISGEVRPALYWKRESILIHDPIELAIVFFLLMTVSWLSNREIEKSLARARRSEHALKHERDTLEIKVEERTRELRQAEREKIAQLYRFAELGKLSSGIFHDLMNPLQAVTANITRLESAPAHLPEVKTHLVRAVEASRRMGDLLASIRKQIKAPENAESFSIGEEIRDTMRLLSYRAQTANVDMEFAEKRPATITGNPLKFHQVVLNLIANAIDATEGQTGGRAVVRIALDERNNGAVIEVADQGTGIPQAIIERIFDPFFTTKPGTAGMGLGLSTTKEIVERDFRGTILVTSAEGVGSTFQVWIPYSHAHESAHPPRD